MNWIRYKQLHLYHSPEICSFGVCSHNFGGVGFGHLQQRLEDERTRFVRHDKVYNKKVTQAKGSMFQLRHLQPVFVLTEESLHLSSKYCSDATGGVIDADQSERSLIKV